MESRELHTTIKSDLDAHLNDLYKQGKSEHPRLKTTSRLETHEFNSAQETAATLKDIQTEVDSYNEVGAAPSLILPLNLIF